MTTTIEAPLATAADPLPADPLADFTVGLYISPEEAAETDELCGEPSDEDRPCGRGVGHPKHWDHIAFETRGRGGYVAERWQTPAAEVDDSNAEEIKVIEEGTLARFRNRRDHLLVLGTTTRKGDSVEVLDLTHERLRVIPRAKLVHRKPNDPMPTPDQMAFMGRFLAERKAAIAKLALDRAPRYWARQAAQLALAEMDIAVPPQRWQGSVDMRISVLLPPELDGQPADDQVRLWLRELLKGVENEHIKVTDVTSAYQVQMRQA